MLCEQIGQSLIARLIPGQKPLTLNRDLPVVQEAAEIVDCDVMDVWRVIPTMRQLFGYRHPSAEHMGKADAPLREVGERNKGLTPDANEMVENEIGPFGGLQCLAENGIVETVIRVVRQVSISVALHH